MGQHITYINMFLFVNYQSSVLKIATPSKCIQKANKKSYYNPYP